MKCNEKMKGDNFIHTASIINTIRSMFLAVEQSRWRKRVPYAVVVAYTFALSLTRYSAGWYMKVIAFC